MIVRSVSDLARIPEELPMILDIPICCTGAGRIVQRALIGRQISVRLLSGIRWGAATCICWSITQNAF